MNLEEVLNYRTHCIICNRKLETKSLDLADVQIARVNEGLTVETGTKNKDYSVFFKNDGTYEKMKKWNDMYVKPLSVLKECPNCVPKVNNNTDWWPSALNRPPKIVHKARSVGMTTITDAMTRFFATSISNLTELRCAYAFELYGDSEGNFDCYLKWEDIMYHDDKSFYHVKTSFQQDITKIKAGQFKDNLDSIINLDVPTFKTNNILSKEKLIEKIKLFNLFS